MFLNFILHSKSSQPSSGKILEGETPTKQESQLAKKKKKNNNFWLSVDIFWRVIATFIASALGVIGAGAIIGVDVWLSAALGGLLAVAKVVEKLALAFLEDGKIDRNEVNMIFSQVVRLKEADEAKSK